MKFKNTGKAVKVRTGTSPYIWKTLYPGQEIELPEEVGKAYGLEPLVVAVKSKIGKKEVETKKVLKKNKEKDFFEELKKIKGIGTKTAKDIIIWGNKAKLVETIKNKEDLPFRDDVVKTLIREYGKE